MNALVETAMEWLGTPYIHQASLKGVGCDCIGFLKGAALEAGLLTPELAAALPRDYSRQPSGGKLRRIMGDLLAPVPFASRAPGDFILIRFEIEPQHIALLTAVNPDYMIHCGEHGVVAHRLDSVWRARIVRVYRFPVLE